MRAALFHTPGQPLHITDMPRPEPGPGQVLLEVRACAVCRTDLHIVDGELSRPKLPLVPGHEIVGAIVGSGEGARRFEPGTSGRRAVARMDLRRLPLLPLGAREFVRPSPLHRL